jgi:hypothetical protein
MKRPVTRGEAREASRRDSGRDSLSMRLPGSRSSETAYLASPRRESIPTQGASRPNTSDGRASMAAPQGRGLIENKHSTDVASTSRVFASV